MCFNSDGIEKCLAHGNRSSSQQVCNKAEFQHQRKHMMQEWANLADACEKGEKCFPSIIPLLTEVNDLDPFL